MHAITPLQLHRFEEAFASDPQRRLAMHALSKSELNDLAFVSGVAATLRHKFSLEIPTMEVTNQKESGRCWLFAATNVLRERIAKARNMEKFELSQSYLAFYDKFERANYFLESMMETSDLPTDDRTVSFILSTGVHDGGQWDMFANIVRKYGIVPKDVYDETYQSSHTRRLNYVLNRYLKIGALRLRTLCRDGAAPTELQAVKEEMLCKIYGFLCSCYGEPPKTFDFEYLDKDRGYHVETGLTPLTFAQRFGITALLEDTVSIIHAPTQDKPFNRTYTIRHLGNAADGRIILHLNLSLEDFKGAILRQMQDGKVVWFGADVGHYHDRPQGLWDDRLFDYSLLSGLDLEMDKRDALDYRLSAMDHAMVLTGVHLEDGKPVRWRIENSWGDDRGDKGYYVCSDSWFNQYVFQAAVEKSYLGDLAALASLEPIVLDPWDPMGTLAR